MSKKNRKTKSRTWKDVCQEQQARSEHALAQLSIARNALSIIQDLHFECEDNGGLRVAGHIAEAALKAIV